MKTKKFRYSQAARVVQGTSRLLLDGAMSNQDIDLDSDNKDVFVTFPTKNKFKSFWVQWLIQNDSEFDWPSDPEKNQYRIYLSMVEPQDTTVLLEDFSYDCLKSQEKLFLEMQIDLSKFNFDSNSQDYMVLMFRILDNTNTLLGDAKEDQMILFIKFDQP